jgi:UTP-glucose-1-phosphate uridylyltransferase/acetyltransferase-like isoleucine patch superfamily enzyme
MKAIVPCAGLGTRLLPTTKSVPKELLPIRGKPAIHWVLEEAFEAGFTEIIVVISSRKTALQHYLTPLAEDDPMKRQPGLVDLQRMLGRLNITFVIQPEPLGLGDAILRCRKLIGDEPFAILLPDNVWQVGSRLLKEMLELHRVHGKSCVALRGSQVRSDDSQGEFVVRHMFGSTYEIQQVISREKIETKKRGMLGLGRYILEPVSINYLERVQTGYELDESPALEGLAHEGRLLGLMSCENVKNMGQNWVHPVDAWKDTWKFEVPGQIYMWDLHRSLREEMRNRWDRSVPFTDELFDRWERAAFLGFGKEASIYDSSLVLGDVRVGEQTWIGPFTVLDGRGGLSIGRYCNISAGCQIYSHDTVKWALTGGRVPEVRRSTKIGDFCYIGPSAIITHGVTIGERCVIGANSLVRQDVPDFSIAVGSPAKIVGKIEIVNEKDVKLIYEKM